MDTEPTQYALYVGGEVQGPFSAEDVEAFIASGEVTPETLAAPVGSTDWTPASNLFAFPEAAAPAPAAHDAPLDNERPELDPFLRKRVIQLGLASATTVDEMTETQARAAVAFYEEAHRKEQKRKWLGGFGAGAGVLALFAVLYALGPARSLTNLIGGIFIAPNTDEFVDTQEKIVRDLRNVREGWDTLKNGKFRESDRARKGKEFLTDRVYVPDEKRDLLLFNPDFAKLAEFSKEKPRFIYLSKLDDATRNEMNRQSALAWKFKNTSQLKQPLDERELQASWTLFKTACGAQLAERVKLLGTKTLENADPAETGIGENDAPLRIDGRRPENLVAAVNVTVGSDKEPLPVFLPYGTGRDSQAFPIFARVRQGRLTAKEALDIEKYTVTDKKVIGGRPYGLMVSFLNHKKFLEQKTPLVHYLGLRRPRDNSPVWMRVDEKTFNDTPYKAQLATKNLFNNDFYQGEPPVPRLPSGLDYKPEPKLELPPAPKKPANAAAGAKKPAAKTDAAKDAPKPAAAKDAPPVPAKAP